MQSPGGALQLPLEGVAGELAAVVGRTVVCSLVGKMRGSTGRSWRVCFYVPKTLPFNHDLVRMIGWRDAKTLSREFGGEILQTSNLRYIERNWRRIGIRVLHEEHSYSATEIAEWLCIDVTAVRRVIAGKPPEVARANPRQSSKSKGA
jgi:hypothetical protein